jgi:aminoglycoside 3-N-acetyltransferase
MSVGLSNDHAVSEAEVIAAGGRPATVSSLVRDMRAVGLGEGVTVMVHSSLSALGYVSGGAQAVVLALLEVVGASGTIAMPAHSGLTDPGGWSRPAVPEGWWETLRAEMPAYDPDLTPTRYMGAVVECFRHVPSARRSSHPTASVVAAGPNAASIVDDHSLAYGLGEQSPLARLYDLDAYVLLLGVSHANNTSLHLAEYRTSLATKRWTSTSSPVIVDGERRWVSYEDLETDDRDFERLGRDFAASGGEADGAVGAGTGRLMRQRQIVDYAITWIDQHRTRAL